MLCSFSFLGRRFIPISPLLAVLITVISILVLAAVVILFCSKHWSAKLGNYYLHSSCDHTLKKFFYYFIIIPSYYPDN